MALRITTSSRGLAQAAPTHDVPGASGERQQLALQRRRAHFARVETPRRAAAHVLGARQRSQARVASGTAVLDRRAGDVQDTRI